MTDNTTLSLAAANIDNNCVGVLKYNPISASFRKEIKK